MTEVHPTECKAISELIKCRECETYFVSKNHLYDHLREVHGDERTKNPCDQCGKIFGTKFLLKSHMKRVHTNKGESITRLICEICGKTCRDLTYLNFHKQVHEEGFKFKCPICGKGFKLSNKLRRHEQIHAGLEFKCPDCPKSFSTRRYLQQHSRCHKPREERKYYYKTKEVAG